MSPKNMLARFFSVIYEKLFKINDSPQRIAIGFGVGVCCGIFPGTGPIASLFFAMLFRVNRASALAGSLITNTWLSVITFILSIKVGSAILQLNWRDTKESWSALLTDFRWADLAKASVLKIVLPVALGYLAIGLCAGIFAYVIALMVLERKKHEN